MSHSELTDELAKHAIELPAEQLPLVDAYRVALWEWNEKINLTRHTTIEKFVTRDVVDTLKLADALGRGRRVLDIGSGGGVPGLLLAIVRPDLRVSVCDSVGKKARVLEDLVARLGITAAVYACRMQEVLELSTFDTLTARAVAPLAKLITWVAPYWDACDELLVIKGRNWRAEEAEAREAGALQQHRLTLVSEYVAPGTDALSVLLRLQPSDRDDD